MAAVGPGGPEAVVVAELDAVSAQPAVEPARARREPRVAQLLRELQRRVLDVFPGDALLPGAVLLVPERK